MTLLKKPYTRKFGKLNTHLELGDRVLIEPVLPEYAGVEFVGTFLGVDESGCPAFRVRHNGKVRRIWGYECWWIRQDEAKKIRAQVAK